MAERRRDLEQEPFKAPPFIAGQIAPIKLIRQKSGVAYYHDYVADAAAQTGRSLGAAPTAVSLGSANSAVTCIEAIKRYNIPESEIALLGGLRAAESKGARLGKRSVMNVIEAAVAAEVLAGSGNTLDDIEADFLGTVATGVNTLRDYGDGEVAFVCSSTIFNRLKSYNDVVERMQFTGVIPRDLKDVRGLSEVQFAACLGVDKILVGPNSIWYTASATYQDRAALVLLPDPQVDPDEEIQFSRTYIYQVDEDDDNMFVVESYMDDNLKANVVDTRAWWDNIIFNRELVYTLDGLDVENTVTTSA